MRHVGHVRCVAPWGQAPWLTREDAVGQTTLAYLTSNHPMDVGSGEHLAACWNAVEAVGGDPATIGELVATVGELVDVLTGLAKVILREKYVESDCERRARALLARADGGAP